MPVIICFECKEPPTPRLRWCSKIYSDGPLPLPISFYGENERQARDRAEGWWAEEMSNAKRQGKVVRRR